MSGVPPGTKVVVPGETKVIGPPVVLSGMIGGPFSLVE